MADLPWGEVALMSPYPYWEPSVSLKFFIVLTSHVEDFSCAISWVFFDFWGAVSQSFFKEVKGSSTAVNPFPARR